MWRVYSSEVRTYLETFWFIEGEVYLKLGGLLRGWDMPLFDLAAYFTEQKRKGCPHVHLTGWGDFPLRAATWNEFKSNHKLHQPPPQSVTWKAASGPDEHLADALSAAWDNLQLEGSDDEYVDLDESDGGRLIGYSFV